jgi:O-antigen/teichoic acid export membrane protein
LRLARALGIDRAIAFTVLARGWSSLAGIGTLTLIARFLTPAEQGFYYTFYSLVAMQIVFELGFSVVILQTASHEAAHLEIGPDGRISGPEAAHARLASVLQKSVRWYSVAAVLMAVVLLPVGVHFFRANTGVQGAAAVHWFVPWCVVVLATACTFQVDPLFSFLEGCGYVPQVARTRLNQAILGTLLGWTALVLHHGLLAPGLMIAGQALAGSYFVFTRRGLLLPLLRHRAGHFRIQWGSEIWPFQWRIAVSWLSGYLTFQLFNPILFHFRGAVEAGQMGMSMNVCGTLSSMAIAWMNTKAAPFGRMIALGDYVRLDRIFSRALLQSAAAATLACAAVWFAVRTLAVHHTRLHGVELAHRLLPPTPLALLFFGTVGNIIVFAEALYLRAHKQEKFMVNSILGAFYTVPIAFLLGRSAGPHGGAWGISAAYAVGTAIIGLGYGTYTFWKWRRIWHAA